MMVRNAAWLRAPIDRTRRFHSCLAFPRPSRALPAPPSGLNGPSVHMDAARTLRLLRHHRKCPSAGAVPPRSAPKMAQVVEPAWGANPRDVGAVCQGAGRLPPSRARGAQCVSSRSNTVTRGAGCRIGHVRNCGSRGWATARGHPAAPYRTRPPYAWGSHAVATDGSDAILRTHVHHRRQTRPNPSIWDRNRQFRCHGYHISAGGGASGRLDTQLVDSAR